MLFVDAQPCGKEWVIGVQEAVPYAAQSLLLAKYLLVTDGFQKLGKRWYVSLHVDNDQIESSIWGAASAWMRHSDGVNTLLIDAVVRIGAQQRHRNTKARMVP